MVTKEVVLTSGGYKKAEEELAFYKNTKRREIAERIKEARAFGDISENSEYDEAKNEQAHIENRISQLEAMLKNAVIIAEEEISTDVVAIGTKVAIRFMDTKDEEEYKIVGSNEANPMERMLSDESPIGSAIIGKKIGDKAVAETPNGKLKLTIMAISK